MNKCVCYFIEISKENNQYLGTIHQGNPLVGRPLNDLQLGPDAVMKIKKKFL